MPKLLAQMVARNESPHYLHQVLDRLKDQVDVIVFTDDCSDDDTPEIAASYGCQVYQMPEPTFNTHEGKLRQTAWYNLENHAEPGDWVLAIDADEELYTTRYSLDELIAHPKFCVYNIEFFHMWNETQFRTDKAWRPHGSTRMFKYKEGGQFANRALACGSEPTYVQQYISEGLFFRDSGLKMKHLSYIKDEDKRRKYERYASIDGGAYHANAHIESILDKDPSLVTWDW